MIFLFCFLLLLSNVNSATLPVPSTAILRGIPMYADNGNKYYEATETQTLNGKQVTFTLLQEKVYFYSGILNVYDENATNKKYFLVIPEGTELLPCDMYHLNNNSCIFASPDESVKPEELSIDEKFSVYLHGTFNLRNNYPNSLDLFVLGDFYAFSSAKIIASGRSGEEGSQFDSCSSTDGEGGGNAGNITVNGTVFAAENASFVIDAGAGNGGDGADGFEKGDTSNRAGQNHCAEPDGTNGGNGGLPGKINFNELILSDSSKISFTTNGGNGGNRGTGLTTYPYSGSDGLNGLATSAGEITLGNILISGNPEISFDSFKGTGRNSADLIDGIIVLRGCGLNQLDFSVCKAGRINVFSDDSLELLSGLNEVCARPRTQIQPRLNCDCYESTSQATETELIFSLTGTAKTFQGQDLSGSLNDFSLTGSMADSGGEEIYSGGNAPGQHPFSNGFFNFSFGKNQQLFSDLVLPFAPFTYLLNFGVTTSSPEQFTDSAKAGFNLITIEQEGCG